MKKSVEVAPYKILFHKRWGKDGYGKFYLQSLLDDKQRIVGFDENGELKKTMVAQPDHPESLFKIYWLPHIGAVNFSQLLTRLF